MGVLNRKAIKVKVEERNYDKKLVVTPLLSEDQIGPASVDIRLGSSIIVPRKTYFEKHDVTERDEVQQLERRLYSRIQLKYGNKFVLHPNQLILAVTFEYISLPADVFCTIASRSSWGRLGLVIATASIIQPGFKGCLTLELANLSENPITLYPGLLVGQLVFQNVPSPGGFASYEGRYDCPTDAGLPQFFKKSSDDEMPFWGSKGGFSAEPPSRPD